MNAYTAAEYVIEAIGKSSTWCIDHQDVNVLIQQASKDVASYLKEEIQNDIYGFLKKFPDVFILNGCTVTLTDAFLSLYAFPRSAEFCAIDTYENVFETSVIEYFKLILIRSRMCNYITLFNVLLNQNHLQLANYYSQYTVTDMYAFFQKHSNTFTILNNNVYLNMQSPSSIKSPGSDEQILTKGLKKLTKSTYFLLTCFESLHYIELKQCISFVLDSVKEFLNMHSLIKQREIFENLPETRMDKMGYISMKHFNAYLPKSRKLRLMILIVCILAFEKEMHFQKLAQEVKRRVSSDVSSVLCEISISEQFKFFANLPDFFVIHGDGYVTLLPYFIFPLCAFENKQSNPQTYQLNLQPPVSVSQSHVNVSQVASNVNTIAQNPLSSSSHVNIIYNTKNLQMPSKSLATPQVLVLQRIKFSMIYLLGCFQKLICENVLKTCLYVLHDIRTNFFNLSHTEQHIYIGQFCDFFTITSNEVLPHGVPLVPCIDEKEKLLLFIVYVLTNKNSVYFANLARLLVLAKVDCFFLRLNIGDQLIYLRQMSGYVTVACNGCISLNRAFDFINSAIDSHSDLFPKIFPASQSHTLENKELTSSVSKVDDLTDSVKNITINEHSITANDVKPVTEISTFETSIPSNIYKKLEHSILFLQNLFISLSIKHILETFLHALLDVRTYFSNLSTPQQHKFIESYFELINDECEIKIFSEDSEPPAEKLTEEEKVLLATTYLLIKEKSLHYRAVLKQLMPFGSNYSICSKPDKEQFKYFKTLDKYFVINGAGYVCLSSSCSSLSSIISSASAFSPQIQKKIKHSIKIKICTEKLSKDSVQNITAVNEDGSEENTKINAANASETHKNSKAETCLMNEIDIIIDLSISVLSVCEKMKIEKLCNYLNSCNIPDILNYFSFYTVSEKINFFTNIPLYFEVSRDGFVSLKDDVISTYVPKTSLVTQDSKGRFVFENEAATEFSSKCKSLTSGYVSDPLEILSSSSNSSNVSNQRKKNRRKLRKSQSRSKGIPCGRRFKIDPLALNGIKDFLNSGNCEKVKSLKTENRCVSSDNLKLEFPSAIGRKITKQHNNYLTNSSLPENDLRWKIVSKSKAEFQVPQQTFESKSFAKENECKEALNTTGTSMKSKNVCSNFEISSAKQEDSDISPGIQLLENPKIEKRIYSQDSLKVNCNDEEFPVDIPNAKPSDFKDLDPYVSYGMELLDSFLGEFKADVTNCASHDNSAKYSGDSTAHRLDFNINGQKSTGNNSNVENNRYCEISSKVNSQQFVYDTPNSNSRLKGATLSVPENSAVSSFDAVELQAINFFSVILGNYDTGLSADFLMKHLHLASLEVHAFMMNSFQYDANSFFLKHKRAFYVSPQTKNVYLVTKS